jgi:hypothetical protein
MSQASLEISASLEPLPSQVQQALNTLDLEPEREIERYRLYKRGGLDSLPAEDLQSYNGGLSRPLIDTTDEEEEEEYELIPPSQPFAIREPEPQPQPSEPFVPGELVLSSQLEDDESLDLSFVSPGEIAQNPNEYLPASKELWRSLGQPDPSATPAPKSRWRLPVAIGSTAIAIASVTGMTYVNTHPALLQKVPMVAQLTAPPAPIQVPPGQSLQGPDLSMGEFTELTLANINSITLPGTAEPLASAAASSAATANPAAISITPTVNPSPAATATQAPPAATVATTPATTAPSASSPTLADSLIRNLLPANIQQLNARPAAAPQAETKAPETKPYAPTPANAMSFQPQAGVASSYQVTTEYQSPSTLAKIQALVPRATVSGNKINLGTFKNKSEAEAVVKRLAQKGFIAQVK